MAAKYEMNLSDLDSEELIKQDELATKPPSVPPPHTSTSNLRGSRSAGHRLPDAQSSRIASSLTPGSSGQGNLQLGQVHEGEAVDSRKCVWITIIASVVFLFLPVAFPCVIATYCSNKMTKRRNNEKDYISAKACGICTRVFGVASFIWGALCLCGLIGLILGLHFSQQQSNNNNDS